MLNKDKIFLGLYQIRLNQNQEPAVFVLLNREQLQENNSRVIVSKSLLENTDEEAIRIYNMLNSSDLFEFSEGLAENAADFLAERLNDAIEWKESHLSSKASIQLRMVKITEGEHQGKWQFVTTSKLGLSKSSQTYLLDQEDEDDDNSPSENEVQISIEPHRINAGNYGYVYESDIGLIVTGSRLIGVSNGFNVNINVIRQQERQLTVTLTSEDAINGPIWSSNWFSGIVLNYTFNSDIKQIYLSTEAANYQTNNVTASWVWEDISSLFEMQEAEIVNIVFYIPSQNT
jgi:hypothetical protein